MRLADTTIASQEQSMNIFLAFLAEPRPPEADAGSFGRRFLALMGPSYLAPSFVAVVLSITSGLAVISRAKRSLYFISWSGWQIRRRP